MTKEIQVKATDEVLRGVYSNMAQIKHSQEEFCLDFFNILDLAGTLNARVIVSPGHLKRMVKALTENLKKYEDKFGSIEVVEKPEEQNIGFNSQQ